MHKSIILIFSILFVFATYAQLKDDCPDGTCDSTQTCCELTDGSFGCCPYANADCCSDHAHCCPNGYQCDIAHSRCVKGNRKLNIAKVHVVKLRDDCPDGTCDSTQTCCELTDGSFGCCPYANADCCSDHAHCCPNGYQCDMAHSRCVKGNHNVKIEKVKTQKLRDDCPDGTCDSTQTCCELTDGSFGCCPYANADCCSDHAHCCPNGYQCDMAHSRCVKGNKVQGIKKVVQKLRDDCPDGTCDSTQTCCELTDGSFGCCPYANADCCSDHAHCCPNGYQCDIAHSRCVKGQHRILIEKVKTQKLRDDCPDGTCDSTQTCCELTDGSFGCCPYANADCCSDHAHCCPNGYQCDIAHSRCTKGNKRDVARPIEKLIV